MNTNLKKFLQKEMTRKDFLNLSFLLFISAFGAYGVLHELLSHAATPYASDSADKGTLSGGAKAIQDPSTVDGEAVQFGLPTSSFVERSGTELYLDGKPFTFIGFNFPTYTINYTDTSGAGLQTSLPLISGSGADINTIRLWWFQQYCVSGSSLNFAVLDSVVALCTSLGIKIIITLASASSGSSYADGVLNEAWWSGGYASAVPTGLIMPYRQYVQAIVTRYANNPTIMMWQFVNEANAGNSDLGANELTYFNSMNAFCNDVGAMVKSIDPNHLTSLGNIMGFNGSGYQWGGSAQEHAPPTPPTAGKDDWQLLLSNQYIDVGDYHDYGEPTVPMSTNSGLGIAKALAIAQAVNKPLMIAETGINWTGTVYNPPLTPPTTAERATLWQAKFVAYYQNGVVGTLIWNWRDNPIPADGPAYGGEVGPSDPVLQMMNTALYA